MIHFNIHGLYFIFVLLVELPVLQVILCYLFLSSSIINIIFIVYILFGFVRSMFVILLDFGEDVGEYGMRYSFIIMSYNVMIKNK